MKKIVLTFGTRPEIIKLAPLIQPLRDAGFNLKILHTGQHKDLAYPMLSVFGIKPDADLNIMRDGQNLFDLTASIVPAAGAYLKQEKPDFVIVQGDTSTAYLTALAAFYLKIPVLHVEAGLRSHNLHNPFPEELNRKLISQIAQIHFAPTALNRQNLLNENVKEKSIHVTGNTIIDALQMVTERKEFKNLKPSILSQIPDESKLLLLTAHRRENHGKPLQNILEAVQQLLKTHPDLYAVFPAHPNPAVQEIVKTTAFGDRFLCSSPFSYLEFLHLIQRSDLILTDSGGIQEEAAASGKPVVVLRNETERQELIDLKLGVLAGSDIPKIIQSSELYLNEKVSFNSNSVYGDGNAAQKITEVIKRL